MATEQLVVAVHCRQMQKQYAVFKGADEKLAVSFRQMPENVRVTIVRNGNVEQFEDNSISLADSLQVFVKIMQEKLLIAPGSDQHISAVGFSYRAPGGVFLKHQRMTPQLERQLLTLGEGAVPQLTVMAKEIQLLKNSFEYVPIYAISESAFHATREDLTWNYDIDLAIADKLDIKRFCYDGLTVESIVQIMGKQGLLERRLIVCNLDETSSVTAVKDGKSVDSTTGYSPNEGILPLTGASATLSVAAYDSLVHLHGDDTIRKVARDGGLGALSGSGNDISQLLALEKSGDYRAKLALAMFVASAQRSIGSMVAVLGGLDSFVFTGSVSEESAEIRRRILGPFDYLGLAVEKRKNVEAAIGHVPVSIQPRTRVKQVYVLRANELFEIAWRTRKLHKNEGIQ